MVNAKNLLDMVCTEAFEDNAMPEPNAMPKPCGEYCHDGRDNIFPYCSECGIEYNPLRVHPADAAQLRERKRQVIREWLNNCGAYSQMPVGGSVGANSPINEVLVDGWVDFETLLNALDGIQ